MERPFMYVIHSFGFMNFIDVISDDKSLVCKTSQCTAISQKIGSGIRFNTSQLQKWLGFKLRDFALYILENQHYIASLLGSFKRSS